MWSSQADVPKCLGTAKWQHVVKTAFLPAWNFQAKTWDIISAEAMRLKNKYTFPAVSVLASKHQVICWATDWGTSALDARMLCSFFTSYACTSYSSWAFNHDVYPIVLLGTQAIKAAGTGILGPFFPLRAVSHPWTPLTAELTRYFSYMCHIARWGFW